MHISVLLSVFFFTVPLFAVFEKHDLVENRMESHARLRRMKRQDQQVALDRFQVLPRIGNGAKIQFYFALIELTKELKTWESERGFQLSQVFGFFMILNIISEMPLTAILSNVILGNPLNGTIETKSFTSSSTTAVVSAQALIATTTTTVSPTTTAITKALTTTTTSPPSTTTSNSSLTNNIVDELLDFF
ncbi:uncharacterized protein LOC111083277 [Limulus polyphemus]|uniref:Uncharacterized protein LOC111083277 n=1 Tax=Limulus polyphemus TaxID=6850 RepID=A0ABM1RVH1_LIMPO|nr:uncharacterized protein LOC111083277 [Limulus polyphemus]